MYKNFVILLMLCFISLNLKGQTDNKNLNEQLNAMKTAFMDEDYSVLADYTYPKIVERMGGKEKMLEITRNSMTKMESEGFIIEKLLFKDASDFLEHKGDLQSAITQVMVMQTPDGIVESTSTIIAISKDNGNNWFFLNTSGMPKSSVQNFYENLHPDLEVKPSQRKVLE